MDKENQQLLLSDFDYDLPKQLIAQTPLLKRDESKLLVLDKQNKTFIDKKFYDIIDILTDEKVISAEMDGPLKEVIEFRKVLVRQFYAVDHKKLEEVMTNNLPFLKAFPKAVETYLVNELGPVSAFLPEDSNVKL